MSVEDKPPLVLVVDDYEDARLLCSEFLEFRGFRVATAADGLEAVHQAVALLPDLILMDLSMPVLDGWEATRRIKGDRRTGSITVVALTAHAAEGGRAALEAGCVAVLSKPIEPRLLESEVRRILADQEGRRDADPPACERRILDTIAQGIEEIRSAIVRESGRKRPA
ncbi:MAG TPA: response regulator [Thermoanaerobaculia bacterium]|jgi:CheY-like chemotaxis protein|nr:response regulator [Thermoanaerobaculia bacterium]